MKHPDGTPGHEKAGSLKDIIFVMKPVSTHQDLSIFYENISCFSSQTILLYVFNVFCFIC